MVVAVLPHLVVRPAGERKPDVDCAWRKHLRRHYAQDRVRLVPEVYRFPQHVRIAVPNALPNLVADHANHWAAHAILFLGEYASKLRLEPDHFKKVSGNESA